MLSKFILLMFFMYFLMINKSDLLAGLFVVIMSTMISDLAFFKHLLMLVILELAKLIINSVFNLAMGIIICFLNGPLVVMLILGFFCLSLLFVTFFFCSQQFITQGTMVVHAYRRNYVWSINTLTFLCSYPTQRTTKESNP